jgi:hypothetical protein
MSKSNNIKLKFQDHMDANRGISSGGHEWSQLTVPGRWGLPRQPGQGDRRRSSQPDSNSSPKPYKSTTIPAVRTEDPLEGRILHHLLVRKLVYQSFSAPVPLASRARGPTSRRPRRRIHWWWEPSWCRQQLLWRTCGGGHEAGAGGGAARRAVAAGRGGVCRGQWPW